MKKFLALILTVVMLMCTFAVSGVAEVENRGGWTVDNPLRIAYATSGSRGDNGQNDEIWAAMEAYHAEHEWVDFTFLECGTDYSLYETMFLEVLDAGCDLFITSANYSMADIVGPHCEEYRDTTFWFIDLSVDYQFPAENCAGMRFMQNEVMFLSGALAASISKTGVIGFVGGTESTVIIDFGCGYIDGATYVNPDIKVIFSFVGNFNDSALGKELAMSQAAAGADVIHNVAGTAGLGALVGAAEAGVWAIGVDRDQRTQLLLSGDEKTANAIIASASKSWKNSVLNFVDRFIFDFNSVQYGVIEPWGFTNGGVEFFGNDYYKENVPEDVQALISKLQDKIINGEIEVSTAMGMAKEDWEAKKANVAITG
ncbi:MAG: BMP family ABC transporter substrate-binding protein [Clostridia bacterium]